MIKFLSKDKIMSEAQGKAKTNIDGKLVKVDTIYECFKGAGKYFAPEIAIHCSKTANQVAYYIWKRLSNGQTSFILVPKDIINSNSTTAKTPDRIRDAIKELVNAGVMIAWKDIEGIVDYDVIINNHIYLLNPLLLRNCSAPKFIRNCDITKDRFRNNKVLSINTYDAIIYDFDITKLNINFENIK